MKKLSNTLIHSNSQNSKLNEELNKVQLESTEAVDKISALTGEIDAKNTEITQLSEQLSGLGLQLQTESLKFTGLEAEFETYKQTASLSVSEQVNELNSQIATLNLSHSDYVAELNTQIDDLNLELKNMGLLLESTTNTLGETEVALELRLQELTTATTEIENLNTRLESFQNSVSDKDQEMVNYKAELEQSLSEQVKAKELEYQKLLAENTNLIEEIDMAQDKVEAMESEITLLKGELDEVRLQSVGKSEFLKRRLQTVILRSLTSRLTMRL